MRKKCWFYICIAQAVVIAFLVLWCAWPAMSTPKAESMDLKEYMSRFDVDQNYIPEAGYIPDAKTAKIIGSAILDKMTTSVKTPISHTEVRYDAENRLWRVSRGYFPSHSAFVIIEQDTGKVVKAMFIR